MEQDKKAKLLKEINDIMQEQEHIKNLLNENNMQELDDYLGGELTQKHLVEKCIHNLASSSMPNNIQENASNAYGFLERLKREKEEELAKYTQTLSEKDLEIEAKKQTVQTNIDNRYEILNQISTGKANFENLNKKETSIKNEIQDTISELDETRLKKSDMATSFHTIEANKNTLQKALEEIKGKREESASQVAKFDEEINNLDTDYRIKNSRLKFLVETEKEKEGYGRSVKQQIGVCV